MKKFLAAVLAAAAMCLPASAQMSERVIRLSSDVRPIRYDITVTPNAEALTLAGEVNIELDVRAPTRQITLNVLDLELGRVAIDGRVTTAISYNEEEQTATFTSRRPLSVGRHTLSIAYRGQIYRQAQGLFAQDYEQDGQPERMLVSQFQTADARRFVPSWDEPAFRAIFDITIIAPQNRGVISNMPEASSENIAGGMKRVRFQPTPSMPTYLMFVGVGDFERITQTIEGVEVSIITKRGSSEMGRFALQAAADVLPWFNDYFGTPYPLPKLDIIAAPGGAGGFAAMENWGAILFFEQYLLVNPQTTSEVLRQFIYTTVAHEIGHMWFGNLVTVEWWDDIWLNEGFASWIENKVTDHYHPEWLIWDQAQSQRQNAMNLDARPTSHPIIVPIANVEQANQAFDAITYQKGYAVIRMFEEFIGEEQFRNGVRAYIRQYAYGNATSTNLWDAIQAASGQPLRQVADDFTRQQGVPLISADATCESGRQTVTLRQSEFTSAQLERAPLLWHAPVTARPLGGEVVRGLTSDNREASLALANCNTFVVNPQQIGYYRVQYSRPLFERLTRDFARVPAADQLGLLYDARALGRAGNTSAADILALARATPGDADPLVLGVIATEIPANDGLFNADDPRRARFRQFARGVLSPMLTRYGWDRRQGEPDNASITRAQILGALSQIEDAAFQAEALRRYRANQIEGPVRSTVLGAVGAAANAQTFDELLARARQTSDTLEKRTLYQALAAARDPALAQRALNVAFEEDVDPALGTNMIGIVAASHPKMAFDFAVAHPDEISARLEGFAARSFTSGLLGASNDPADLARLRAYIDANVSQNARRTPEANYAQLADRLRARERRLDEVSAFIGSARGR